MTSGIDYKSEGSGAISVETVFLVVFLSCNIAFLVVTAIWFRFDHASTRSNRFSNRLESSLIDEIQWQYSLRSNLLLWGCALSAYLLAIGESISLLVIFAGMSLLNVITDQFYQYPEAQIFSKARKGHMVAAVVICMVAIAYFAL